MPITPEAAARALVERATVEHQQLEQRRQANLASLPAAARALRAAYGARRVVLFGSLAWGGFHWRSDVDLAVAGVPADLVGRAMAEASRIAGVTVELFDLDALPESFRARILAEGTELP
jgi:predicted nucleotidyltransferase